MQKQWVFKRTAETLTLAMMLLFALLLATSSPATAHINNQGTIKVHDSEEETPPTRNVPHVDCDFWIEGFNIFDDSGTLVFYAWPPTGDMTEVMNATWTGEDEGDGRGFHFLAGPFTLETGHYRVEAFSDVGHPGNHSHFAKSKTFWVECGEDLPELPCPPAGLSATANEGGSVTLTFNTTEGADGTNIYRATGDGDFEYLATVGPNETTYTDGTTAIGVTYTYTVSALFGDRESFACEEVEVTAIPVFPTLLAGALAATLAIGAYAFSRRRR